MSPTAAPLIVTAELGAEDLRRFDALRRRHFPPERNLLQAHLTMFHALPPSVEAEAAAMLAALAKGGAPVATIEGPYSLGRGVAFRVRSDKLVALRERIADHFHGLLSAQDAHGWRPHITVQNKVSPDVAKVTLKELQDDFRPWPLKIAGFGLHRYIGGPWERIGRFAFRG